MYNMQQVQAGTWLVATPLLQATAFEECVVWVHENSRQGVLGFVVNHPYHRGLHHLAEFSYSKPIPLFTGGPVGQEHVYCLHTCPTLISGGIAITPEIYRGANMHQLVNLANKNLLQATHYRLFLGYCGWDHDQLSAEIAEGSWQVLQAPHQLLFHHPPPQLWQYLRQLATTH